MRVLLAVGTPSASNGLERAPRKRRAQGGVVVDVDAGCVDALAEAVLEEGGAARDAGAADGAGHVADQAAGDAGVEHHGHLGGGGAARVQPCHRLLAGAAADGGGVLEVRQEGRGVVVVVPLHAGALAGQGGGGDGVAGAGVAAGEPGAGGEQELVAGIAGLAALGIGYAFHRAGCVLGDGGADGERVDAGFGLVGEFEGGGVHRAGFLGEAAIGVFGHDLGHGDGALGQGGEAGGGEFGGGDGGAALADVDRQFEAAAFGALQVLGVAEAAGHADGGGAADGGLGGVGAGRAGAVQQRAQQVELGAAHAASRSVMVARWGT